MTHINDPLTTSPCISLCQMDADTGLCKGCFRTIKEITDWSSMQDGDKRSVWLLIEQRQLLALS